MSQSWVYFVQAGISGPIKIGYASDPAARLKELQVGSAEDLRILAVVEGRAQQEAELHRLFADYRIRGEWFKPAPELLGYIETLRERLRAAWALTAATESLGGAGRAKHWREEHFLVRIDGLPGDDPLAAARDVMGGTPEARKKAHRSQESAAQDALLKGIVRETLREATCKRCGQKPGPEAMRFRRVRGEQRIGIRRKYYPEWVTPDVLRAEMAKCDIICANCSSADAFASVH